MLDSVKITVRVAKHNCWVLGCRIRILKSALSSLACDIVGSHLAVRSKASDKRERKDATVLSLVGQETQLTVLRTVRQTIYSTSERHY